MAARTPRRPRTGERRSPRETGAEPAAAAGHVGQVTGEPASPLTGEPRGTEEAIRLARAGVAKEAA